MDRYTLLKIIKQAAQDKATELNLSDEGITSLPIEIGQLTNLTELYLDNNQLTSIPPELGKLTELKTLRLQSNQLKSIPPELTQLTKLTELYLHNNKLTSIPFELSHLTNMEVLRLDSNELKSVPAELAKLSNLTRLDLDNNQLKSVPPELAQLTNLTLLVLKNNQLTSIPPELGKLTKLTQLYLSCNQLTSIPAELGKLTNLTTLYLNGNQLTSIPAELTQLTNLTLLDLDNNQLKSIPAELGKLTNLTELLLYGNQLTSIPPELGKLTNLTTLYLSGNQLTSIPAELTQLTNLTELHLGENQLKSIPPELGKLTNLTFLFLDNNQLTSIPPELGKLTKLTTLDLDNNQLTSIPPELAQLTELKTLRLHSNRLTNVPKELGQLKSLQQFSLHGNQLKIVPPELGQLPKLWDLTLLGNPLESPPIHSVEQGTKAILAYLRGLEKAKVYKWEAKLLIVGQAGVGKTELVKALRGEHFGGENATEGVLIRPLEMKHPTKSGVTIRLNMWDFGGQEIQQATHQFFYSERALFVLAWNARENYEQAKLNDWLELIQARASVQAKSQTSEEGWRVPVLLVATHRDLWRPDIPYQELERQFPGIRFLGLVEWSNKTRRGMEGLLKALAEAGADLPLMGMSWPGDWEKVEDELAERVKKKESRMPLAELWGLMEEAEVSEESRGFLTRALDGMGKIRAFLDDEELRETVVLDPQWLTSRIARVLKNEDKDSKAICKHAILRRKHWGVFWSGEAEETQRLFVKMMRNFDLVYELEDSPDAWLVVQLLPYQLGESDSKRMRELWSGYEEQPEITMKFRLEQSIPPGIPTWFIAREHRFSLELHWRLGVMLADDPEKPRHLGLVQAFPEQRYLKLTVRGPMPHNFFVLLRDGLEVTLKRFSGLKVKRKVPCPGHDGEECEHEFDFRDLEGFVERGQDHSQCQKTGTLIGVNKLLYGIHESTTEEIAQKIDELRAEMIQDLGVILTEEIRTRDELSGEHREIIEELRDNASLLQRGFIVLFNALQELEESHCPNVFAVLPKEGQSWLKNFLGQKMVLQLYCQAPGDWHPVVKGAKGGRYEIKKPAEFFKSMGPYILKLAEVIKYAAPVAGAAAGFVSAGPGGAVMGTAAAKKLAAQIKLMEELAKKLVERDFIEDELLERTGVGGKAERIEGMKLRALRALLDKEDSAHEWGGLKKVLTPEGHYLWLCAKHKAKYKAKYKR